MKRFLYGIFLVFMVLVSQVSASSKAMIIFDASGSMWGQIDGKAKISIARDALKDVVKGWNENIELGLTVYGHRRKGDCNDIETIIPISKVNKTDMVKRVSAIMPKGKTPIAKSLRQVANKLKGNEDETTIILISDGKESCSADPCGTAKQLKAEGIKFVAHVIGFNVDKATDKQLQCIANATGGEYFSAKNASALNKAIKSITKKVEKPKPVVKKLKNNLEVTASETEGGKWVRASCYAYNSDETDHWYIGTRKNKAGTKQLPVGKYTLKCSYNKLKKETFFEITAGKTTKVHMVFEQFKIIPKCDNGGLTVSYEVYANNGRMVFDTKQTCSKPLQLTLNAGDYNLEAKVNGNTKKAKFTVGGDKNSMELDLTNLNKEPTKEELIEADTPKDTPKAKEKPKEQKEQTKAENVEIKGLNQKNLKEAGEALNALGALLGSVTKEQKSKNQESDKKADKEFKEMSKSLDMFSK